MNRKFVKKCTLLKSGCKICKLYSKYIFVVFVDLYSKKRVHNVRMKRFIIWMWHYVSWVCIRHFQNKKKTKAPEMCISKSTTKQYWRRFCRLSQLVFRVLPNSVAFFVIRFTFRNQTTTTIIKMIIIIYNIIAKSHRVSIRY